MRNLDYFNCMIVAACCLHNFTLDIPFVLPNDAVDNNDWQDEENDDTEDDGFLDPRAVEKKKLYCSLLCSSRRLL